MTVKKAASDALERAVEIFDLPGEAAANMPRVTVTGRGRLHIENHRGLLEYGDGEIDVNSAMGVIRIKGERLELSAMTDVELVAAGRIFSVEFLM